jgi:hypothetical protein
VSAADRVRTSPGFWLACSVIFTVNALLAAARDDWVMAILQTLTGVLASTTAFIERGAPTRPGRSVE